VQRLDPLKNRYENYGDYVPAKILIVDDHEIVREGIRTLITRSRPGWTIVGEASSGVQAIEMCEALNPDVMVLDITMPGMSGLEAASRIAASDLECRILMFTMHESERLSSEVRQAGAQGFVLKSQAARDLIRAIDCLLGGGTFFGTEPPAGKDASDKSPSNSGGAESAPAAMEHNLDQLSLHRDLSLQRSHS
jgi:DNA-binding NarL/FixJ family response regulator